VCIGGDAMAREVILHHRELAINAELYAPRERPDNVVLITHGGLGHRGMEPIPQLQGLLQERGYATLAINLSLGIDDRHGMYDCGTTHRHLHHEAAEEIGVWVRWLKTQGVKRVVLLGHSRGAAGTALYASGRIEPEVQAVILLAPDTRESNDAVAYETRHGTPLAPLLKTAVGLVRPGEADVVLEHVGFLYCPDAAVTARTFVSYYGWDPRLDTAHMVPGIERPVLILLAGDDEIVVDNAKFEGLSARPNVKVEVIDHAGHFFRDLHADDAVDAIDAFLYDLAKESQ
jgi:pimeloyl-ACP methyl ester carboxylesterase